MCYRVSRDFSDVDVRADKIFEVTRVLNEFEPKYNVAITDYLPVIILGSRILDMYKWGLIPHWAKDRSMGAGMGNARAETILEKPSFKNIFVTNRCLVLASGFFEWDEDKNPYYFKVNGQEIFAFAGLWDEWTSEGGEKLRTVTIITCEPNESIKKYHNRMPVVLSPKDYEEWLKGDFMIAKTLLKPFDDKLMIYYPVTRKANSSKNNSLDILQPLKKKESQKTL
jgi:putative SOS response-associated peptidase YedK